MGRHRGDADVLFVHDQAAEEKVRRRGFGLKRSPVMYNDFVIVGPKSDPAGAKGKDVVEALKKIAASNAPFVSRGDKSGTHAAELRYWKAAASTPRQAGSPSTRSGCGMGQTLNIAASTNAYRSPTAAPGCRSRTAATSRSWSRGDTRPFNQYGVIVVTRPGTRTSRRTRRSVCRLGRFADGQAVIASYRIGGEQLFLPNAGQK